MIEDRIQGGGLAGAGRSRHQDHAVGTGDHQLQYIEFGLAQAQAVQRHDAFLPVQHAQHKVFAVLGRLGRGAKVDLAAGKLDRDAAILRRARLGDVHIADDFQAHRHRRPVGFVQAADLPQDAVDAIADAQKRLLRLEVDVGGAVLHRVGQQRIDQAHHGLAVFIRGAAHAGVIDFARFDLVQDAVDRQLEAIVLVDGALDVGIAHQQRRDGDALDQHGADLVQRHDVVGVRHRQDQVVAVPLIDDGKYAVALGHFLGDQLQCDGVHHQAVQVRALLVEVFRQRFAHRVLGDEAQRDQQLAQRFIAALLLDQRDAQLVFADDPFLYQQFAEREFRLFCHGSVVARAALARPVAACAGAARRGRSRRPGPAPAPASARAGNSSAPAWAGSAGPGRRPG